MANWSELQYDVLVHVAKKLNLIEDYLNFATVCKPWRRAATKNNFNSDLARAPWLMLPEQFEDEGSDTSSFRQFFSLYNDMTINKRIPKADGKRCLESLGWLITVGKDEGEIRLLHPFSGVEIELPHQNTTQDYTLNQTQFIWNFIHKAVLSASPSRTSDYVVMVIAGINMQLNFWRPGDLVWTRIGIEDYRDVVYFNGKFYAVNRRAEVLICHVTTGADTIKVQKVAQLPSLDIYHIGAECYILESLGSLLVVVRHGGLVVSRLPFTPVYEYEVPDDEDEEIPQLNGQLIFRTHGFRVYKVYLVPGKLVETKQIRDRAIFLGANASLSVQASQFPGIKRNHIYFTDDCYEAYSDYEEGGGLDMGFFNIKKGFFLRQAGLCLNRFTPPIWVTPNLY